MPVIWVTQDEADTPSETAEKFLKENMVRVPLDAGDYAFFGKAGGRDVTIGVERKKVNEDLAYCIMRTNRHLEQLRRCVETYDRVYLVIEGDPREGSDGMVEVPHWVRVEGQTRARLEWLPIYKGLTYNRLTKHLETIEAKVFHPGRPTVRVRRTKDFKETCRWLETMAEWWEDGVESHKSAEEFPEPFSLGGTAGIVPRIAKELRGVGIVNAAKVGRVAQTPADLHRMIMDGVLVDELDSLKDPVSDKTRKTGLRIEDIQRQWRESG